MFRILFVGENWYGSCARACCYALRRLGHDVLDIDAQTMFPQLRLRSSRAAVRLAMPRLVGEHNNQIIEAAAAFRPDLLMVFKGTYVTAETVARVRAMGAKAYNYYPDTSMLAHGRFLPVALPEYDCVFSTKWFQADVSKRQLGLRRVVFLPHGYDPEIHRPWPLSARDRADYGRDVAVIATHTRPKETRLGRLIERAPSLDLRVWGNGWMERCRSERVRRYVAGHALNGTSYARAIAAARINLALMSGPVGRGPHGDTTTTRTFEIPACGGFMLHERSDEVRELFEEGREIDCFESVDELAEKIEYYLAHPDERARMAEAAYQRCVPNYSYDSRMAQLVEWHQTECG